MKTNKTELLDFLNLLVVKGQIENKEMIISGKDKEMESLLVTPLKEFIVKGVLKVEDNFLGELGIGNVNLLKSMLNNIDGEEITIHRNENKIVISSKDGSLVQQFCLKSNEYIKNTLKEEDFEKALSKGGGNEISISKSEIEKILKLSKSMNSSVFFFRGDGKKIDLFFETNENNILYSFVKPHCESFYVKISKKLLDLFEAINSVLKEPKSEIVISMRTDKPIILKIKNNNYEITYLLAQLTKKESE